MRRRRSWSQSGLPVVVLRPTLMFGWFDRKHLGWLARFMQKAPVFPIPGNGRYLRQPLYAGDFCDIIMACIERRPSGTYNISGQEKIDYIDLIRAVKAATGARAPIVRIPYSSVLGAAVGLRPVRPRSALHDQAARGAGDARRVRVDRLAGDFRRDGDAARGSARRNVSASGLFAYRAGVLMSRVVVIGAGAMGLAAAYHALKRGHHVTVLEAAPEAGGMAAHFDLGGLSIERYYHFVCKADRATFDLLGELGIGDRMRWVPTSMGYYIDGKLHRFGRSGLAAEVSQSSR